jgi:hypothetical protein
MAGPEFRVVHVLQEAGGQFVSKCDFVRLAGACFSMLMCHVAPLALCRILCV